MAKGPPDGGYLVDMSKANFSLRIKTAHRISHKINEAGKANIIYQQYSPKRYATSRF